MSRFRPLGRAVTLVRPFLDVTRREIVDFLNGIGASFRNDASNFENDFTRNRIRNELLPMLREQFNPRIDAAVRRWARLAGETEEIVGDLADSLLERVVRHRSPSEIVLAASELRRLKSATLRALLVRLWKQNGWPLRDMGFEQWKSIADCFFHGTAPLPLPGSVVAERRGHLFILRRDAADSEV